MSAADFGIFERSRLLVVPVQIFICCDFSRPCCEMLLPFILKNGKKARKTVAK
ncbi:MAG: hypothetical protein WKF91_09440 [Segetibacter sp.]